MEAFICRRRPWITPHNTQRRAAQITNQSPNTHTHTHTQVHPHTKCKSSASKKPHFGQCVLHHVHVWRLQFKVQSSPVHPKPSWDCPFLSACSAYTRMAVSVLLLPAASKQVKVKSCLFPQKHKSALPGVGRWPDQLTSGWQACASKRRRRTFPRRKLTWTWSKSVGEDTVHVPSSPAALAGGVYS